MRVNLLTARRGRVAIIFCVASLAVPSFSLLLSACGGGSNGGGGGGTPPPSGLIYPAPPAFVVGKAIAPLSPTVTGTVSAYTVSPALPIGLGLSASSGAISGTPTAVTSAADYTVTASNSGGSTTTTIKLTVNDAPPAISYGGTSFVFTAQQPVHLTPTNSGGSVVTWSISPAPPAGLTFGAVLTNAGRTLAMLTGGYGGC
jgi:hypothetical protein